MHKTFLLLSVITSVIALTSCESSSQILSGLSEREANVIIVFLESKGMTARKEAMAVSAAAGGDTMPKFNIYVSSGQAVKAMAVLNQNGLPQQQDQSLLQIFAKSGLMSSDKEETIRYQAGLAQQLGNMIRMIDGVIDAAVQISFPPDEATAALGASPSEQKITAAVYVKHQGVYDDPNSYLETKIKRLVSGSITGLSIDDVTVVSDRSRFTDVSVDPMAESISPRSKEFVKVWSMVMNRESVGKFRFIFFLITAIAIILAVCLGWIIWKVYPIITQEGGFNQLFDPKPIIPGSKPKQEETFPEEPV
ncbi:MAG: hypothetical protein S4CHLAM102_05500 [Chlamydiia bacterium]|nr:hypothetical protein [Chlamydiia bacterium]